LDNIVETPSIAEPGLSNLDEESANQTFNLVNAIPNLVWMTDASGKMNYINQQFISYSGAKSYEELILNWHEYIHESDRPDYYARWNKSLETSTTFEKEFRIKDQDGNYRWFLGRAIPITDKENVVRRWVGTATDIDGQKNLLSEIQNSRDHLEIILEGVTDGITVLDKNGNFIYANGNGAKMCGFNSVEEFKATPTTAIMDRYTFLDEDGQPFPIEKLPGRLALKGIKNPPETILQIEYKDTGKRNWSIVSATPVFDNTGEVQYAVSIFRDFTAHKENENSLKSRESAFRLIAETGIILNSSLDYMVTLQKLCELIVPLLADWCIVDILPENGNPHSIVWHWNPTRREWATQVQAKHRPDWRQSPSIVKVVETAKPVLLENVTDEMLVASARNSEHLVDLRKLGVNSVMVVPILGNESVLGAISFMSSESKRKFSSFDLTLAEDVGRRAGLAIDKAFLYESERKARKLAEDANNSKSTFLANMSHEIRTPLNALIGFNELLRSNSLSGEERSEYHNIIQRNGELLLHLIDDILDLSKVEAGHLAIETVKISLDDLLNEIKSFKTAKAAGKGLQFIMEVDPTTPKEFVTDPIRLKQILNNIIGNAIKFTMSGHVKVKVHSDLERKKLVFAVTDTGIGIKEEDQAKLFQPFSQADASVTRKYGGTGLGLILSKRLAQRLGGDLYLENSSLEKGATFKIEVATDLEANSTVETVISLPEKSLKNCKVLVVDDSVDNQVLIEHMLKSRGAKVDTADNGQVGLTKALENDYDVVLMDVQMPVLDGHSATRILREKGYIVPIIGLTAHAMQEDRKRCLEAGCSDYLTKPIRSEMLVQTISRHIN
jgi:PAS domain S-box-containing protein